MSRRPGLFTAQTREREPLPIVAPGKKLLGKQRLEVGQVLTALPCESEAVYLWCKSPIHVSVEGSVSTDSPPIDARGGSFMAIDIGAIVQIQIMDDEEPNICWVFDVK